MKSTESKGLSLTIYLDHSVEKGVQEGWALEEQGKLWVIQQCEEGGYVVKFKNDLIAHEGIIHVLRAFVLKTN